MRKREAGSEPVFSCRAAYDNSILSAALSYIGGGLEAEVIA
jgi:hypothetical protein